MNPRARWAGPVLALLACACGSMVDSPAAEGGPGDAVVVTAPGQVQAAPPPASVVPGSARPQPASPSQASDLASPSGQAGVARPSPPQPAPPAPTGTPQAPPASPSLPVPAAPSGPPAQEQAFGVTDATVSVGIVYASTEATNSMIAGTGAQGTAVGSFLDQQRALVQYLNDQGGVAGGRQVVLVEHEVNPANDPGTELQAICSDWTQDHQVYAGVGTYAAAATIRQCLAEHGAHAITTSLTPGTTSYFAETPDTYYAPASLEMIRSGRVYVEALDSQAYFDPGARIGVLYLDTPEFQQVLDEGVVPALSERGLEVQSAVAVAYSGSYAEAGSAIAQVNSAELRFASEGITHVLFLDSYSTLAFFFIQQAQNQGYRPRYGLNTTSVPSTLATNFGSSGQLNASVAVGWAPAYDVAVADIPPSPARNLCSQIMTDAGQQAASGPDLAAQQSYCSTFFFLADALHRTQGLAPATFRETVEGMTDSPASSAFGYTDGYGPGKHWGTSAVRTLGYRPDCTCYQFLGGEFTTRQ